MYVERILYFVHACKGEKNVLANNGPHCFCHLKGITGQIDIFHLACLYSASIALP